MSHDVTTRTPSGGGGAGPALIPVPCLFTVTGMVGGDSTGGVQGPAGFSYEVVGRPSSPGPPVRL